jgi:hypothetical protein
MMHGGGKSDSAIVAVKPTNKAGQPAAEPAEPRAGAKGNASERRTHRAQDRASVSQALDRVRQAARLRKKERFTALFHHLALTAGSSWSARSHGADSGWSRSRPAPERSPFCHSWKRYGIFGRARPLRP